jgi:hypothetical protein
MIEITKKIVIRCDEGIHDFVELNKEYGWPQSTHVILWCKNCGLISTQIDYGSGCYATVGKDKIPLFSEVHLKDYVRDYENGKKN